MSNRAFRTTGIVFWAAAFVGIVLVARKAWEPSSASGDVTLAQYLFNSPTRYVASDPTNQLRANDPVFFQDDRSRWHQIGYVTEVIHREPSNEVTLAWYHDAFSPQACRLVQFQHSGRLEDVIATLLPAEKRLRIQQRLAGAMSAHGDDLSEAFVPLVQETLKLSIPVIEEELRKSIASHRDEIDTFAQRWNEEIIEQKLLPLAKQEIIPIVRRHGQPPAEEIGQELWDRASIFRFGWRAVYDKTPLPRRDLVREEWERFVEEEAVPIFEAHMDDIVVAVERIISDVAANDAIRAEFGETIETVASDPDVQQFIRTIMRETLIENDRLREVWGGVWQSDQARAALDLAGDRLEPVVRQIGDDLFGTQEDGIDPDFARVLRNQILGKDRRWIVAVVHSDSDNVIRRSENSANFPVIHTVESTEVSP